MTPGEWSDLSDSELRTKLVQRGLTSLTVDYYVSHREDEATVIDRLLGVER